MTEPPDTETIIEWLTNEIDHASMNGHVLEQGQGISPGEKVPAIRSSNIEAVIERIRR